MTRAGAKGQVLAGMMRQRIRIESPVLTPDGMGGWSREWEELTTVWAQITAVSGDERIAAGQLTSEVSYRIRLRWREDITPQMRIVFGARIFAIRTIIAVDGKKRTLEIMAEEGVGS